MSNIKERDYIFYDTAISICSHCLQRVDAKIVFLDEVGAGVNKTLLNDISDSILRLNKEKGYTFCMIEHDMDFITRMCDPVIVMSEGSVLFEGTVEEVKSNEQVIESYLGRRTDIKKGGN